MLLTAPKRPSRWTLLQAWQKFLHKPLVVQWSASLKVSKGVSIKDFLSGWYTSLPLTNPLSSTCVFATNKEMLLKGLNGSWSLSNRTCCGCHPLEQNIVRITYALQSIYSMGSKSVPPKLSQQPQDWKLTAELWRYLLVFLLGEEGTPISKTIWENPLT